VRQLRWVKSATGIAECMTILQPAVVVAALSCCMHLHVCVPEQTNPSQRNDGAVLACWSPMTPPPLHKSPHPHAACVHAPQLAAAVEQLASDLAAAQAAAEEARKRKNELVATAKVS
jgi:hypothetical protein